MAEAMDEVCPRLRGGTAFEMLVSAVISAGNPLLGLSNCSCARWLLINLDVGGCKLVTGFPSSLHGWRGGKGNMMLVNPGGRRRCSAVRDDANQICGPLQDHLAEVIDPSLPGIHSNGNQTRMASSRQLLQDAEGVQLAVRRNHD